MAQAQVQTSSIHETALGTAVTGTTTALTTTIKANVPTLQRPTYMLRGALKGDWHSPELLRIHNQFLAADGVYRI